MKQPELHLGKLVMVQVPVHPLLLKTTKGDGHTLMKKANARKKGPYYKTISFVFSASLFEVWHDQGPYPNNVRHHINKARHGQLIGDEKPSGPEFLLFQGGSQKIQSVRTGRDSQRQTKQCTGGNASLAADQMWGFQLVLSGTHFEDNSRMPRLAHEDLREETPQQHRDQQHPEFCPELSPPRWCWH